MKVIFFLHKLLLERHTNKWIKKLKKLYSFEMVMNLYEYITCKLLSNSVT